MYAVGYRTGDAKAWQWLRMPDNYRLREEADRAAAALRSEGHKALVYKARLLDAIGLPETYE